MFNVQLDSKNQRLDLMCQRQLIQAATQTHAALLTLGIGSRRFRSADYSDLKQRLYNATCGVLQRDKADKLDTVRTYLPELSAAGASRLFAITASRKKGSGSENIVNHWVKVLLGIVVQQFPDDYYTEVSRYLNQIEEEDIKKKLGEILTASNDGILGKHEGVVVSIQKKNHTFWVGVWLLKKEWIVFGKMPVQDGIIRLLGVPGFDQPTGQTLQEQEVIGKRVVVDVVREKYETALGTRGARYSIAGFDSLPSQNRHKRKSEETLEGQSANPQPLSLREEGRDPKSKKVFRANKGVPVVYRHGFLNSRSLPNGKSVHPIRLCANFEWGKEVPSSKEEAER